MFRKKPKNQLAIGSWALLRMLDWISTWHVPNNNQCHGQAKIMTIMPSQVMLSQVMPNQVKSCQLIMPNHANHVTSGCYFSMHLLQLNKEPTAQGEVGAMQEAEEASEAYSNPPEVELAEASEAKNQQVQAVQVAQVAHATPAQMAQAVVLV